MIKVLGSCLSMIVASDIPKLSKREKLTMMELLWADLTSTHDGPKSPSWHSSELQETQKRYQAGHEDPVDWTDAKKQLRNLRG